LSVAQTPNYVDQTDSTLRLDDLKVCPQWVCFSAEKIPYNPLTGYGADCNLPETWTDFSTAWKAYRNNPRKYSGIGYEFVKEQHLTGIDLDKCINEHGEISPFAQDIVRRLNSYTEISPSGKGLHIIVQGNIPSNIKKDLKKDPHCHIEMYDHSRYFTMTGKHLKGTPETIEERQEVLMIIYQENATQRGTHMNIDLSNIEGTPYGLAALVMECDEVATMPEGGRNDRLNLAAYRLGQLVGGNELQRAAVEQALTTAAYRAGLGIRETASTIRSGLEQGIKEPRARPIDEIIYGTRNGKGDEDTASSIETNQEQGPDLQFILDRLDEGEYGDSLLFAHLFRGKVLYDLTSQEWYKWAGHWWILDEEGSVKHLVSGKLASIYLQACARLNIIASQGEARADVFGNEEQKTMAQERAKKAREQIKQLHTRAYTLRQISRCKNVLSFAQSHEGMSISATRWDRNTWLLAVPNGVLDLHTSELREGHPQDYIRTICPTKWTGLHTPAPRWERFLQEIFEDRESQEREELISFLQRLLGYGITGEVIEHIFAVFFGEEGRNGKDTLQLALSYALGAISGAISKDVLLEAGRHSAGAPTPHLSDLQGRRLAWASEPERGARFSVGQVKELSGGGEIPTRGLHEKKITKLQPTHLLILLTNHKPHADASDAAFWDRLRLITFNMRFVDNPSAPNERKKDTTLWSKLKEEAPGILAWLIRGCLEWQEKGLSTPCQVLDSVKGYRAEEDVLNTFIEECCIALPESIIQASNLYSAYKSWGSEGNMYILDKNRFGTQMSKKFKKGRNSKGQIIYTGIGLLEPASTNTTEYLLNTSVNGHKASLEEALGGIKMHPSEYHEYQKQEFTKNDPYIADFLEKPANGIHGIQRDATKNGMNEPVEPFDTVLKTSEKGIHGIQYSYIESLKTEALTLAAGQYYQLCDIRGGWSIFGEKDYRHQIAGLSSVSDLEELIAALRGIEERTKQATRRIIL